MKILYIINRLGRGGAQRLLLDICKELNKRSNIEYKIIGFENLNEFPEYMNEIDYFVCKSNVKLSIFSKNRIDVEELRRVILDFKPNVIHSHLFMSEMYSRQIFYPKANWFTHFHDNIKQLNKLSFPLTKEKLTDFYERRILIRKYKILNNRFICISNSTLLFAKKNLPPKFNKNLFYLPNAIDYSKFRNRTRINHDKNILNLVTVGSLVNKKNQLFLLKVVRNLISIGIDVRLNILGNGPNFKFLLDTIENYNLVEKVFLKGITNQVEEYFWDSHIYVHSALDEPFGLVLIEAMAAGLPVITLDGKGNRDLIEQGKNGYMIYKENAEMFAEKILEIWYNKELYTKMSNYAQEYAKQYDIKEYVDKLLKIYEEA